MCQKFVEHYLWIASSLVHAGEDVGMWDEEDGFFYDVLRFPNGEFHKFRLRSLVGVIPLYAIEVLDREDLQPYPHFLANVEWFIRNRPDLVGNACYKVQGDDARYVLSIADAGQFSRILQRLSDPEEFLSDHGIRSISRYHKEHPFRFGDNQVGYEPGESEVNLKGGNSNWRGPIWFPTSYLLIQSLLRFADALGEEFKVASPAGTITPCQTAREIANRMIRIFARDQYGRRACFGHYRKFQEDPHWRDYLLFNEYYHGDTGMGLGASHQTGWSGLVANLIDEWRR